MYSKLINLGLICLPLLLGVLVSFLLVKIDNSRFSIRGVGSSYISAIALVFSLYGGLMAKEVWDKRASLDREIGTEISALRSLLRITEAVDPNDRTSLKKEIFTYVEAVRKSEYETRVTDASFVKLIPMQSIYDLIVQDGIIEDDFAKSAFLDSLEKVRSARIDRLLIEIDKITNGQIAILFLFGFLTQIAIGLAHAGNPKVVVTTIMLFSLGFSGSIFALIRFDDAYRTGDLMTKTPLSKVK